MRKLLWIMLLCMLLPVAAMAADALELTGEAELIRYAFTAKDKPYALLQYRSETESGQRVVFPDADGVFRGEVPMRYTPQGGQTTVKVLDLKQNQLLNGGVKLPATPGYSAPTGKGYARVTDLTVEPMLSGFWYCFRADGADYMKVKGWTRTQTVVTTVTPDENGWFSGVVTMDDAYAYATIQVSVLSANGDQLAQLETIKNYAPIAPVEQNPNGRLKGVIVCIDPGHQLKTQYIEEPMGPGLDGVSKPVGGMAQGKATSRLEHMVTLEVAYVLRNELLRQGATVVMTRTEIDQFVSNIDRDNVANEAGAHIMLRLHCDNVHEQDTYGVSINIPLNSEYAKAAAPKDVYNEMGRILLDDMRTRLYIPIANHTGRVVLTDKFVGNNWAKMLCFLVEMGYMSNPGEDLLMSAPEYQQWLAEGMAQGVYDIGVARGWIAR